MTQEARRVISIDPPTESIAPFDDRSERIYAVMVTGKTRERAELARVSVLSFLAQTYGNRALVIINDGEFELEVPDLPPERIIKLRPETRLSLGQLRNRGLDAIPEGAVWTYWDDDDWRHPLLMAEQYRVMSHLGVHACFLRYQIKYAFPMRTAYVDRHPGGFAGTLMSFKHPRLRFPDCARDEDSVYTASLKQTLRWYPWNNPPYYFLRLFHGSNTWDATHFGFSEQAPGTWRLSRRSADYLGSVLRLYGFA